MSKRLRHVNKIINRSTKPPFTALAPYRGRPLGKKGQVAVSTGEHLVWQDLGNTPSEPTIPDIVKNYTHVIINTVKDAPMIPSVSPILTTNGFLMETNIGKIIVTTAHTFFAEAQTPDIPGDEQSGQMQNTITVNIDGEIHYIGPNDVVYSRSLDIAFIIPDSIQDTTSKALPFDFITGEMAETCFVSYTDVLSRTDQIVEGKYVPFIQGQVDMFAITNTTSGGTSGTPVFNSKGKILGMVAALSGSAESYSNMTLCIPGRTLKLLFLSFLVQIRRHGGNPWNLDDEDLFAGIFVNSIEPHISMYIDSSNGVLRNQLKSAGGQRVIYAGLSSNMYPWDIVTKVTTNNKAYKIGGNAYSLNRVLLENLGNEEDLNLETYRIDDYYFERFFQVSQTIYCEKMEITDPSGTTHIEFEPLSEIVQQVTVESSNVIIFDQFEDVSVFNDNADASSLFYIGQQIQYSQIDASENFWKFDRNYATIVDISSTNKSITLNKKLNGTYLIAIIPLGIGGWIQYNSPTKYQDNVVLNENIAWSPWEDEGEDYKKVGTSYDTDWVPNSVDVYKFQLKPELLSINNNVFIVQSFTNLLFLMISSIEASEQEKIEIMITEINYLYGKLQNIYTTREEFLEFISPDKTDIYWTFLANCVSRFGQNAITMFNVIPDPPYEPNEYDDWDEFKQVEFDDIYTEPISNFAATMEDGSGNISANSFNNSLINTENGWFYGTVSDRSGQSGERMGGMGGNIASQQLEMILENLLEDGGKGYLTNLTSIAYLMESCGVSWNNLLIAHNYRKQHGLDTKLIFNKV